MWRYLVKAAISAVLIWLLVRNRDLGGLASEVLAVNPLPLTVAAVVLFALLLPQALRWSAVLEAMGHPRCLRISLPLTMIGLFFSQTLPTSIGGDGMRAWELHRDGLALSSAVSSVLIDRAAGLAGICLLVTATFPLLLGLVPDPAVETGVALLLVAGYGGIAVAMLFDQLPYRLWRFRVVRGVAGLSTQLRAVLLTPRPALIALGTSLVYQVGTVGAVVALARGLRIPVDLTACLVIVPIANLATVLPISISGWGVREGAFVAGFSLVGVAASDAIALSVLFGLLTMLVGVAGGLVWLARYGRRSRADDGS
ncbi:MAG TPA: lysylphosphatidylglycerol synthase transmembrane domain-containing protein [Stellaceae bacterium]|nr:lysylphosphatidylglycerol synthase transmembrane domain-containing protein [Stellaceae bacterium]